MTLDEQGNKVFVDETTKDTKTIKKEIGDVIRLEYFINKEFK